MSKAMKTRTGAEGRHGWSGLLPSLWDAPDLPRLFDFDRMRLEEVREDDAIVVRAELPGVDPEDDIDLTVRDGVLTIRAERQRCEEAEEEGRFFRTEFQYGSLVRRVPLAEGVTEHDISATYRDGILEVRARVPEADDPEPRHIPIARS